MSDPKRRTGAPNRPPSRSAAPARSVNTVAMYVVAAVAVLLAVVIIQRWKSNDDKASTGVQSGTEAPAGSTPPSTPGSGAQSAPLPLTSNPPKASITVQVANSSGVGKAAGKMTDQLKARGYGTAKATNVKKTVKTSKSLKETQVYFAAGQATAGELVKQELGLLTAAQQIPAEGLSLEDDGAAMVVVLLGQDLANKALPAAAAGTDTPATGGG